MRRLVVSSYFGLPEPLRRRRPDGSAGMMEEADSVADPRMTLAILEHQIGDYVSKSHLSTPRFAACCCSHAWIASSTAGANSPGVPAGLSMLSTMFAARV